MEASELRIGNLVYYASSKEIVNIVPADIVGIDLRPDLYEGIPLQPEILEKAGFEKGCPYSRQYGWGAPNIAFFFEKDFTPKEVSSGRTIGIPVEYLHQLQNLYFCLCGEELEISL